MKPSKEQAEEAIRTLISWIGDDPSRADLKETPARVSAGYLELFQGYSMDPAALFHGAIEEAMGFRDLITLSNIEFVSYCEHHMSPIIGHVDISYLPDNKIIGIGRLARLVDIYAKRLQIQERMTMQIANTIDDFLKPRGVSVTIFASHHCLNMGGVTRTATRLTTNHNIGCLSLKNSKVKK